MGWLDRAKFCSLYIYDILLYVLCESGSCLLLVAPVPAANPVLRGKPPVEGAEAGVGSR